MVTTMVCSYVLMFSGYTPLCIIDQTLLTLLLVVVSIPARNNISVSSSTIAKCKWIQLILYSNVTFLVTKRWSFVHAHFIIPTSTQSTLQLLSVTIGWQYHNQYRSQSANYLQCQLVPIVRQCIQKISVCIVEKNLVYTYAPWSNFT